MVPTKVYWCYIVLQSTLSTLKAISLHIENICLYGGFLQWWHPTTIGFPTKNDHFGCFGGTTISGNTHIFLFMYIHVYTVYMYIDS